MAAHVFSSGGLVMFGFKFPASGSLPVILSSLVLTFDVTSAVYASASGKCLASVMKKFNKKIDRKTQISAIKLRF